MYTLNPKQMQKYTLGHITVSVFLALFGAIYEHYSHQVFSYYMLYAFAIPLAFGALPCAVLSLQEAYQPRAAALRMWNCAIAAFTVGSLFKGVLDIYGTTNQLIIVYPIVGGVLALISIFLFLLPALIEKI